MMSSGRVSGSTGVVTDGGARNDAGETPPSPGGARGWTVRRREGRGARLGRDPRADRDSAVGFARWQPNGERQEPRAAPDEAA
jgi:hypothetical protein